MLNALYNGIIYIEITEQFGTWHKNVSECLKSYNKKKKFVSLQ